MKEHMHQMAEPPKPENQYTLKTFLPLILIFSLILLFTLSRQLLYGWDLQRAMYDFMGSFFVVFGGFKLYNLRGFAEAYSMYDIIAKKFPTYGFIYPFLEVGLGIAYLFRLMPFWTNIATFILMTISSIGVANELRKKNPIVCACLGAVFKIPMTYVTLAEDVLMAAMALWMLFM